MKLRGLPNSYIHVPVSDIRELQPNADWSWEYINSSQIHECGNWETEHYNSVLEITRPCAVSFLGIHKSEPDICFRFSPALHLQYGNNCIQNFETFQKSIRRFGIVFNNKRREIREFWERQKIKYTYLYVGNMAYRKIC